MSEAVESARAVFSAGGAAQGPTSQIVHCRQKCSHRWSSGVPCRRAWLAACTCTWRDLWSALHIQRVLDWGEHLQRRHGQRYDLGRVDISGCGGSCQHRPPSGKASLWAIGSKSMLHIEGPRRGLVGSSLHMQIVWGWYRRLQRMVKDPGAQIESNPWVCTCEAFRRSRHSHQRT